MPSDNEKKSMFIPVELYSTTNKKNTLFLAVEFNSTKK